MVTEECTSVAIQNVAVAMDSSAYSDRAVQHALAVARHFGATLHLLHLVRPSKFPYSLEAFPSLEQAADRECQKLIAGFQKIPQLGEVKCRRWVEQGEVPEVVSGFVENQHINLLVVGTRDRSGIERMLLGSAAEQVFHCARCPVLTVGPVSPGASVELKLKRVLFATDLSRESLEAIPYVISAVHEWHTELDVLHVCAEPNGGYPELISELRDRLDSLLNRNEHVLLEYHLAVGRPSQRVLSFTKENKVDLIVLGLKAHRSPYSTPVWSEAHEIVRRAICPVLSVRSAES